MCDAVFAEVNFVFAGQPADGGVEVGYGEAGGLLQFLHLPYVLVLVVFTFCCVLNVFHFTFFIIWPGWTFILSGLAEPWKTDISEF